VAASRQRGVARCDQSLALPGQGAAWFPDEKVGKSQKILIISYLFSRDCANPLAAGLASSDSMQELDILQRVVAFRIIS
jgi:hypothetical protein